MARTDWDDWKMPRCPEYGRVNVEGGLVKPAAAACEAPMTSGKGGGRPQEAVVTPTVAGETNRPP